MDLLTHSCGFNDPTTHASKTMPTIYFYLGVLLGTKTFMSPPTCCSSWVLLCQCTSPPSTQIRSLGSARRLTCSLATHHPTLLPSILAYSQPPPFQGTHQYSLVRASVTLRLHHLSASSPISCTQYCPLIHKSKSHFVKVFMISSWCLSLAPFFGNSHLRDTIIMSFSFSALDFQPALLDFCKYYFSV